MIGGLGRAWTAAARWRRRDRAPTGSVALGFAWPKVNLGGVRRHLDSIARLSRFSVCEYPGPLAARFWPGKARREYELRCLRHALRQDLIHSHVKPSFVKAGLDAHGLGKPWVHTYHALYFAEDWGGRLLPWQQEINRCLVEDAPRADVKICVSEWLAQYLHACHGIDSVVIPNGVDVGICDAARGVRFVQRFGGDGGILFLGSLAPVKNPAAFVEMARRFPRERFVMAGANLTWNSLGHLLGADPPSNVFAIGPLSGSGALDAVAACRAFVMTSRREGLPTALLEAMSLAKPCVVPRGHGCLDALGDESCGFLYEPGDLDDLETQLRRALGAGSMSAARRRVQERFSWGVVMPQIDAVYERLLANGSRGR